LASVAQAQLRLKYYVCLRSGNGEGRRSEISAAAPNQTS
jgi:hypothetical protein